MAAKGVAQYQVFRQEVFSNFKVAAGTIVIILMIWELTKFLRKHLVKCVQTRQCVCYRGRRRRLAQHIIADQILWNQIWWTDAGNRGHLNDVCRWSFRPGSPLSQHPICEHCLSDTA